MILCSGDIIRCLRYLGLHGVKTEEKIREVLESEYRRRLTRYGHVDRLFRKKYGMIFAELERNDTHAFIEALTAYEHVARQKSLKVLIRIAA